jgi:hypothetical protein
MHVVWGVRRLGPAVPSPLVPPPQAGVGADDDSGEPSSQGVGDGEGEEEDEMELDWLFPSQHGEGLAEDEDEDEEGEGESEERPAAPGPPALTDGDYLAALHNVVLPLAYDLQPQVVLAAAGFGALAGDPHGARGRSVPEPLCGPAANAASTARGFVPEKRSWPGVVRASRRIRARAGGTRRRGARYQPCTSPTPACVLCRRR